ncbi:MAG: CDP-diacylglycerol--glycerol-3-phosphate 3-phosphatidyltransferase [Ignavibacteriales bacterium]|nr:MAG: CDP-diacylglycerol--glycerol-3-phosphate 3-phosphatidyltransferase [Ignavibacteriaceae bacterium]MBW7872425.1 CDP-diacylglycerol--glycerol-3-phosphate 3-phosphatidyltransferase [Ignavibacteria bacterium]MCZ2143643.1 CDP-diacylglycerol--glycerol-3-phosphate 3-phosphatidyltransferase [Ignavibacteriales bacterium]OQY74894.1 MAG: CDP-diacylglycerol--glycerol-3-phosphate 3-phosphatidyltransferase [Ignavibacteriales bacterium UTCHB3]MBV6445427.1 CDP-diacylglycerol--glycerol-3-phosphate 3-phos
MILPNQLTVLRIILTPFVVFFMLGQGRYYSEIAIIIYIVAALTDWYDGWLAKKFNYFTNWGKVWDPIADKVLTAGTMISLVYLEVIPWIPVAVILLRDIFITGFRSYAEHVRKPFPTSRYAKVKTFIEMVYLNFVLISFLLEKSEVLPDGLRKFFGMLLVDEVVFWGLIVVMLLTVHSAYLYVKENFNLYKDLIKNGRS